MKKRLLALILLLMCFGCSKVTTKKSGTLANTTSKTSTITTSIKTEVVSKTKTTTSKTTNASNSTKDEIKNIKEEFDLTGVNYKTPTKKFTLHSLIANHAVFQAEKPIEIFGKAEEGTIILVKLTKDSDKSVSYKGFTVVNSSNEWSISLEALEASFDSYTLTISDTVNESYITDCLIGEVWVASGQSNMGIRVKEMDEGSEVMKNAQESYIRIFYQKDAGNADLYPIDPAYDVKEGVWKVADNGSNIATCSAVAYTFAYELFYQFFAANKEVPVAIINTQKGGSSIHSWLPRESVLKTDPIKNFVLTKGYSLDQTEWNTFGSKNYNQVSALYNQRVAPLMKTNIKGVIWYQGENDPLYDPTIYTVRELMDSWSKGFNKNDELLYFALIQLHPYDGTDYRLGPSTKNYTSLGYANHRKAQFEIALDEKYKDHVQLVPIYDVDLHWDVPKTQFSSQSVIHPVVKKPVGERTAKIMYSFCYAKNNRYLAPIYESHTYDDNSITITLKNTGKGLCTFKDSDKGVTTVEVILTSGKRVNANCVILNPTQIIITGIDTSTIQAFSYSNFSRNEESNLASSEKIPVIPFVVDLK